MIQKTLIPGYVIDTSGLIDLWRVYYPPDIFSTLWERNLEEIIHKGLFIAPKEVFNELQRRDDNLWDWAKNHKKMFIDLDEEQVRLAKSIISKFPELIDSEKTTPDADPFVIGLAFSKSWAVIASERSNPKGNPRIPDVCRDYNIRCIKVVEFLRERGWKF
jgi:hypothetical protein